MEHFFAKNRVYAVAGASADPAKFGHKILRWYVDRQLPVTPIGRPGDILGLQTVGKVAEVKGDSIGLSVVTPPAATKSILGDIDKRVAAVWLQPGTHNPEIVELAKTKVPVVITDCVLVKGDQYLAKL